jgi:hypothetical protein
MVSDVYRSRRGLVAGPPVPTIRVTSADTAESVLRGRVAALLHDVLHGTPVSVLDDGDGVVALLPMVEPADAARAYGALRASLDPARVDRRALNLEALAALGPLGGRLDDPEPVDPGT